MQEATYIPEDEKVPEEIVREFFAGGNVRRRMNASVRAKMQSGYQLKTIRRVKIGRNAPCPCGSGRKFKKCCIDQVQEEITHERRVMP